MRDQPSPQETAADASHTQALHTFDRRLVRLLFARNAVRWMTLWFFVWGVVVLAVRIGGGAQTQCLGGGFLSILSLLIDAPPPPRPPQATLTHAPRPYHP